MHVKKLKYGEVIMKWQSQDSNISSLTSDTGPPVTLMSSLSKQGEKCIAVLLGGGGGRERNNASWRYPGDQRREGEVLADPGRMIFSKMK